MARDKIPNQTTSRGSCCFKTGGLPISSCASRLGIGLETCALSCGVSRHSSNKEINMLKKIIIGLIALVLVAVGIGYAFGGTANASEGDQPCVPSDAYDEVIHHDAVTHVVHHDAVTHVVHHDAVPAGPNLWWNWSPNHHQGPFDGPPAFPVDDRGTWEGPHENGGPSQDTFGTFQQGEGHGSWFHREHGTPGVDAYDETVVDQEADGETVVDQEAYDEVIHHDAVVCPPNPGDQPPPIITTTHTGHHEKCAQFYS